MTAESGHFPNRVYEDQLGNSHMNGANLLDSNENVIPQIVAFTPVAGAGGSNICNVTIQIQDGAGNNLANVYELEWYLSDSSVGAGLTATSASGTVGAGSAGTDVYGKVSKKAGESLTDNTGKYILSITDTAKTGFYVVAVCPGTGITWVSAQLQTSNYG